MPNFHYVVIGSNNPEKQKDKVQYRCIATWGSCMLPPDKPSPFGMKQVRRAE